MSHLTILLPEWQIIDNILSVEIQKVDYSMFKRPLNFYLFKIKVVWIYLIIWKELINANLVKQLKTEM